MRLVMLLEGKTDTKTDTNFGAPEGFGITRDNSRTAR